MKKILIMLLILLSISGCTKQQPVQQSPSFSLSVEQINDYKNQITMLVSNKSWMTDSNISYKKITIPLGIANTYYEEILAKSKDAGLDFTKYLGRQAIEVITNIKYNNGDIAGTGHFLFAQDKIIGAYYTVGNYIYSLNEKEVFKRDVNWKSTENTKKKTKYKETQFAEFKNLIYWGKYDSKKSYLFCWERNKLKLLNIDKDCFVTNKEISLEGLYLVSMFFKDIDADQKSELGILLSTNEDWKNENSKSKLIIYDFDDKLKQKYSLNFGHPMWSVDFDGKDIILTSSGSIEIYGVENNNLKKIYAYNRVGGTIKVDDIDNSGIPKYILIDSKGMDVYIFQRSKDGLEEIWRSYNKEPRFGGNIQTGDLNQDGVKEIYIEDKFGNMTKIILKERGFIELNDIKVGHKYFIGDFNMDNKYEYFDIFKIPKTKKVSIMYKY